MAYGAVAHFLIAVHFWYGCYYDANYVKIPIKLHDMGDPFLTSTKLKYLTYWNAILQSVFFTICFLNDILGSNEQIPKKAPLLRRAKDILLPALAFPLSFFVGITFWGLYFTDRELVFPKSIDPYFPSWLNHIMHTNIMVFTLVELLTSYRKFPSRKTGLSLLLTFKLIYLTWMNLIYLYSNQWVYPIFYVLNWPQRILFFIGCFVLVLSIYFVGELLNKIRWGTKQKTKKKRT